MEKSLFILLFILFDISVHSALPMNSSPKKSRKFDASQCVLMDFDQTITDKFLLRKNPAWQRAKKFSNHEKNDILATAEHLGNKSYPSIRVIIALAVCIGANPEMTFYSGHMGTPIWYATLMQDLQLVKYLLAKGAKVSTNYVLDKGLVRLAESSELAQTLIAHGAQIPKDILLICCENKYPASLLAYYLAAGKKPTQYTMGETLLHKIMLQRSDSENQVAKMQLLMQHGVGTSIVDLCDQTALHTGAQFQLKNLCMSLLAPYLFKHEQFLTLLGCLKKQFPHFYKHKDLLKLLFKNELRTELPAMRALLATQNNIKKTAYDIWPIEELNPATCTFSKYKALARTKAP